MPERILVVAHGHPELSAGGAEIAAYRLFNGLRSTPGITAFFIAADDPTQPTSDLISRYFDDRPDEIILHYGAVDPFSYSQRSAAAINHFTSLLERIRPDIVHFHHYVNLGVELFKAAREACPQARIILTLHEYRAICANYGQMVKRDTIKLCHAASPPDCERCFPEKPAPMFDYRERFIKRNFEQIDLFLAPSDFLRHRYVDWGINEARIGVAENGTPAIDPPPPRRLRRGEGRSIFGFFGQINPYKGLIELLTAFEHLNTIPAARTLNVRLRMHGAFLELNSPQYIAQVHGLLSRTVPQTKFFGPYRQDQLREFMSEVDWVVIPSVWWENAPLVIEEALAHRRPVICGDIGGMAEKVRPNQDGFHIPVGRPRELAELFVKLAADSSLWDKLQLTMRAPISTDDAVANHLRIYDEMTVDRNNLYDQNPSKHASSPVKTIEGQQAVESNRTASIADLNGSVRLFELGPGEYVVKVAAHGGFGRAKLDANRPMVHVCQYNNDIKDRVSATPNLCDQDVWIEEPKAVVVVKSPRGGCRLFVTIYGAPGRDMTRDAVRIRHVNSY